MHEKCLEALLKAPARSGPGALHIILLKSIYDERCKPIIPYLLPGKAITTDKMCEEHITHLN